MDKKYIIDLKLRERERIIEKIKGEDKKFSDLAIQVFLVLASIYTFVFAKDQIGTQADAIEKFGDVLVILVAPSLCLGVLSSAVLSIVKQTYMRIYISGIENFINQKLGKNNRIEFFEDWNLKKGYDSHGIVIKSIYTWYLAVPIIAIMCAVGIMVFFRYKNNLFDNVLISFLIIFMIYTITTSIMMIINEFKKFKNISF